MDECLDEEVEVVETEAERRRRRESLERFAGWLKDVDVPGWETPEATAEWVHRGRRGETSDPWADAEERMPE